MKVSDTITLFALAALWGGSYLFLRIAADEFGALPLAGVRAGGGCLLLLPLLVPGRRWSELRAHWRPIFIVGLAQSALPYFLFSYAALTLLAGWSAILTATTPVFAGIIAWLWWRERLTRARFSGWVIGFIGVLALAGDAAGFPAGGSGVAWAVLACLAGSLSYGWAANYTKRRLSGVAPLTIAAGSQAASALVLAGPTVLSWPVASPSLQSWAAVAGLCAACTALAYVLFFRLVTRVGPARTVTVTFLIPVFGVLWGALVLGEPVTLRMVGGGAIVLLGTALTIGALPIKRRGEARVSSSLAAPARAPENASTSR